MHKKHYKKNTRHRSSNILTLNRNQRMAIHVIADLIRLVVLIVTFICRQIWELSIFIGKRVENHYALSKLGYSLDDIMEIVDNINPHQFEVFTAELFKNTGIYDKVEVTKKTNDYGRDCILTRNVNGIKEITYVECKHWKKNERSQVGREICQKLLGSCQMYNADKAIVITTGLYHRNAYEVAKMVGNLTLLDSLDIKKMLLELDESQLSRILMRTLNAS